MNTSNSRLRESKYFNLEFIIVLKAATEGNDLPELCRHRHSNLNQIFSISKSKKPLRWFF